MQWGGGGVGLGCNSLLHRFVATRVLHETEFGTEFIDKLLIKILEKMSFKISDEPTTDEQITIPPHQLSLHKICT